MSSRISGKKKRSHRPVERPAHEADRRFALLVALMTPDEDHRSRRHGLERRTAFNPPAADEGEGRRRHLPWQHLIFLLSVGCLIAAILFIVAAPFISR
jgi:hypothetical protein